MWVRPVLCYVVLCFTYLKSNSGPRCRWTTCRMDMGIYMEMEMGEDMVEKMAAGWRGYG